MPRTAVPLQANGRLLADLYRPIAADLESVERVYADELASAVPYVQELVAHLGHYRGKRLRPALLLLTARACGQVTREHHVLAAVVEMVHTATLVHDDILDHADLRRHVPTVHAKWDNTSSVLLGDLLFTHAFYLTSTTGSAQACRILGEATNRVCEGELRQIGERGNLDLTEAVYHAIIQGKTAELTACCCQLGALFSAARENVVEGMTRYGKELGIAFQIADDVLDPVGNEERTGKSLGTDLEQRKLTLPLIRLLQTASPEQAAQARRMLGQAGGHDRMQLANLLEESGGLTHAIRAAERHAQLARHELHLLPPSESRQILEDLTHRVVHRSC